MYRCTVGDAELRLLDDGSFPFPARYFFSNVPEDTWRRELVTDAEGKIEVGHNCALIRSSGKLILADTGYGDDTHGGRTGQLLDELAQSGHRSEDIDVVVNTHAHGDHTSRNTVCNNRRREPSFPNAQYYLGLGDWLRFNGPAGGMHHFNEQLRSLMAEGRLQLVEGELQLTPEVLLLPTPGHTPGHMSIVVASKGTMAIYLGDLCHHPLHFAHIDWVSCYDTDPRLTPKTRAWMFQFALDNNALLVCPHAAAPGLGRLRQHGHAIAWIPAAS